MRERLSALQLVLEAPMQVLDVTTKLDTHAAAARQLRSSRAFASVLAHVLALGNFLNYGNARVGNARGFRISNLNKLQVRFSCISTQQRHASMLQNTKSLDGSSDLLRWVAEHVLTCHQRLLAEEVQAVMHPNTKVPCSELAATLEQVGLGVAAAARWLNGAGVVECELEQRDGGHVALLLRVDETRGAVCSGLARLQQAHRAAVAHLEEVEGGFAALLLWYGEQAGDVNDAEFWTNMAAFATRFTSACRAVLQEG